MQHVYDFYKPDMKSEYPVVDAKLSIQCYLSALDTCYKLYKQKAAARGSGHVNLGNFDAVLFHSPYCKLVQKSLARLALNDFLAGGEGSKLPELEKFQGTRLEESYFDRDVEKAFMAHSQAMFNQKTKPGLRIATNVGNMYTPSLYGGLVSFMVSEPAEQLAGRSVALFSYGSGMASSFFSLRVSSDCSAESALDRFTRCLADTVPRLEGRTKVAPAEFVATLSLREKAIDSAPFAPIGGLEQLFPGTFHLEAVDDKHRREYGRTQPSQQNGHV
jgi:hydroxymethylglutaryl-CoA synthase